MSSSTSLVNPSTNVDQSVKQGPDTANHGNTNPPLGGEGSGHQLSFTLEFLAAHEGLSGHLPIYAREVGSGGATCS